MALDIVAELVQYDAAFLLTCVEVDVPLVYSIHKQEQQCKKTTGL